jgi:hypothetical protein
LKFGTGVGILVGEMMSGKEFGENQWLIFYEKITILPVDQHSGHKVGYIVFILGKKISKYNYMSGLMEIYWLKSEIKNVPKEVFFSTV